MSGLDGGGAGGGVEGGQHAEGERYPADERQVERADGHRIGVDDERLGAGERHQLEVLLGEGEDRLAWLGKMGATSLKTKVAASIVAISSIHLLKIFMAVETTDNQKIMWYMILHMTFVVSAIGMAYLDYRTAKDH